jgi:hypothetical protein
LRPINKTTKVSTFSRIDHKKKSQHQETTENFTETVITEVTRVIVTPAVG